MIASQRRSLGLAALSTGSCALARISFQTLQAHVDRTVYITDGCLGALGAHEIYLNAQACRLAPVRLTGNFGSEVLRGVSTFKPIGLSHDLLSPAIQPFHRCFG